MACRASASKLTDFYANAPTALKRAQSRAENLSSEGATAIVCASDSLAMGALAVTDNRLTVVGFDDYARGPRAGNELGHEANP